MPQFGSTPFKQFGDDAQALWIEWSTKLHNRLKEGLLGRAMASHLSKYEKLVAALALIFHLVDSATPRGLIGRNQPIRRAQLERALSFSVYLETHASRVYSSGTFGTVEAAKLIHKRIANGDLRDGFSAGDIYRPQWSGLTDSDLVNKAVELLVDVKWIRQRPLDKKGATYSINPKLAAA
jgi:putative DNA primase/helicase